MARRILVVDDETVVLGAVTKALRKTDFHIETAESAKEALELLAETPFDVVITDLMMPGMDGLELMQQMRNTGNEARTIMLTGYPSVRTALRAKQLGAFEYVTKPFTRQELLSAVVRAIRQGKRQPITTEDSGSADSEEPVYFIPEHSWARMERDKTVRIGMAKTFAASVGDVLDLELPTLGDRLEQGRMCLLVRAKDGVEHHLYSPLSGQVLEVNYYVMKDINLAVRDCEGAGWLLRLAPQDPKREIENLVPVRPPDGRPFRDEVE